MSAPMTETVHVHSAHVPSRPPAPPHSCVYGLAPPPDDPHAHDGAWCLSVNGAVLVGEAIDPVRDAAAALREQGVDENTHVTLYAPSHNVMYSGKLATMSA